MQVYFRGRAFRFEDIENDRVIVPVEYEIQIPYKPQYLH